MSRPADSIHVPAHFAARANMSSEDFVKALAGAGVEAQTYRDFVTSGMIWREVVKAVYGGGRVQISDAEIDRVLSVEAPPGTEPEPPQVLLSEIVIRIFPGREAETMAQARKAAAAKTEAEFAAFAKDLSSAKSAPQGGRLDWMPVTALPPEVRQTVQNLTPGRTSGPIETPNSVSVAPYSSVTVGKKVRVTVWPSASLLVAVESAATTNSYLPVVLLRYSVP